MRSPGHLLPPTRLNGAAEPVHIPSAGLCQDDVILVVGHFHLLIVVDLLLAILSFDLSSTLSQAPKHLAATNLSKEEQGTKGEGEPCSEQKVLSPRQMNTQV